MENDILSQSSLTLSELPKTRLLLGNSISSQSLLTFDSEIELSRVLVHDNIRRKKKFSILNSYQFTLPFDIPSPLLLQNYILTKVCWPLTLRFDLSPLLVCEKYSTIYFYPSYQLKLPRDIPIWSNAWKMTFQAKVHWNLTFDLEWITKTR